VNLYFRGQKTAKVVGQLAMDVPEDGSIMRGILVRRNFNYHLLHPNDLSSQFFILLNVKIKLINF